MIPSSLLNAASIFSVISISSFLLPSNLSSEITSNVSFTTSLSFAYFIQNTNISKFHKGRDTYGTYILVLKAVARKLEK
ncbi:hypothetical protein THF1C08_30060 [Vibrio jasicida]|nr:hypothetical protein THF1C08_30060 [Vibrio jasicida]